MMEPGLGSLFGLAGPAEASERPTCKLFVFQSAGLTSRNAGGDGAGGSSW